MTRQPIRPRTLAVVTCLLGALAGGSPSAGQELSERVQRQVRAIYADKAAWTPAQRKLETGLLYAGRQSRGLAMVQGMEQETALLGRIAKRARVDKGGMAVVDVRAEVTDGLLQAIAGLGGKVLNAQPAFGAVRARLPIREVETLAALPEVRHIGPQQAFLVNTGTLSSQGDVAHAAASARSAFGLNGTGVKVGVLSDGVDSLGDRQATGDLPPTCAPTPGAGACLTVMPGQEGSGDEGTAMLEIVHDLAPGAQLFFASAFNGAAAFAANILALKNTYGCDVIVDDVTYLNEGAFQDGVIAQAVNAVTAGGALFFSSAGNSGRFNAGTSGTWEGDFFPTCWTLGGAPIHGFDGQACPGTPPADNVTAGTGYITLKWSDPLAGSANDYDLFLFDPSFLRLLDYSAMTQDGTQDPFEGLYPAAAGEQIVVAKYSGADRALRIDTNRGRLAIATRGAIFGHNGGENTISVAAANVSSASGGAFTGGAANPVETYSSDGPRKLFYLPDGSAITPGNVLFGTGGGRDIRKPDITAADCVSTTTPGFSPFCGTSAAAPHAAAIAALLKSAPNHPSGGQALTALFATALDVSPVGRDRDSGVGLVMASAAASRLTSTSAVSFYTVNPCRAVDTRELAGPTGGAPLTCGGDRDFTLAGACGVPSGAKAVSLNVTVTEPSTQGNLRLFSSGAPAPLVSSLNYAAGQTRANDAIAPLSSGGQIAVRCAPSGTAHVIVDVNGYFQ